MLFLIGFEVGDDDVLNPDGRLLSWYGSGELAGDIIEWDSSSGWKSIPDILGDIIDTLGDAIS
jgi:hypothetical protein